MTNHELSDIFELLSKLMDIHGDDSFRAKSYASAAFRIGKAAEDLSSLTLDQLKALPAIGASLGTKITEINQTGQLKMLEEYLEKTPAGVVSLLGIKGIGPKKISVLWKELGIESLGELEYACEENRLVTLKGFGAKTQASILASIQFIKANSGFSLYVEAEFVVDDLSNLIKSHYPTAFFSTTGAFRRQEDVLNQLEFVTTLSQDELLFAFEQLSISKREFPSDDIMELKLEGVAKLRFQTVKTEAEFYTTLFKTTAEKSFLAEIEKLGTLPENPKTESDIFEHIGLAFIPAALRNNSKSIEWAKENNIPELIQTKDIKGIIHSHSTYSDGKHSLEQMAKSAIQKGYEYLVISDHSQAAFYANGLSPERIVLQHQEIDKLNAQLAPFKIFKSIEADILNDGRLDYDEAVLSSFDLVIASVHSNLKMQEEKAMQRLLAAVENPHTRILGHPTGRLLLSRAGYPVDYKKLVDACVANEVVLEINAHPRRLDIDWTWIEYALEKGVLLSIDPDAHSMDGMDLVKYGVLSAQKGALTAKQNLSSFSLQEFEQFLKDRKFRIS